MADAPSTPWREPSPAAGGHRRCARTQIGKSTDRRLSDPNPAGQWRVSGACSAAMASAAVCNIILFASSRTVVNLNLTIPLGALFGHFLPVLSAHKLLYRLLDLATLSCRSESQLPVLLYSPALTIPAF